MYGTIQRLFKDKGFGYVRSQAGIDYFFHRSESADSTNWNDLKEGQELEFHEKETPKGPRAEQWRLVSD